MGREQHKRDPEVNRSTGILPPRRHVEQMIHRPWFGGLGHPSSQGSIVNPEYSLVSDDPFNSHYQTQWTPQNPRTFSSSHSHRESHASRTSETHPQKPLRWAHIRSLIGLAVNLLSSNQNLHITFLIPDSRAHAAALEFAQYPSVADSDRLVRVNYGNEVQGESGGMWNPPGWNLRETYEKKLESLVDPIAKVSEW